jgi:transposase
MLLERDSEIAKLSAELDVLRTKNAELAHNVEVYRRMVFGPSTERRTSGTDYAMHPSQGHLFAADLLADAERLAKETGAKGAVETSAASKPRKKGRRRSQFPSHLPTVSTRFELPDDQRRCSCCGELHEIGVEETKELERVEITVVHKLQRVKYACRCCQEGVTTARGPARVIEKGLLGPGFLANVAVERFGNHMPYNRLEKKYENEGLRISRSVLERSMASCAELLEPIWKDLRREVLESPAIFTDDTTVTIARGSSGKSRRGRAWIYLDQKGTHFYDFTESRRRDGPLAVLEGYTGFIHADAYPGYDALFLPDCATEVACWCHARRKFLDAEKTDPELAGEALDRIRLLFAVERRAKDEGLDADPRLALRQSKSVPVLEELRAWLGAAETKVLPKSPMGGAIRYAMNQWDALVVHTTDGRLELENNAAERALRAFAVGRKNWMFVQTIEGGIRSAILMSLVMTAKAIGLNAITYLRDVLLRISTETDVKKLTPRGWQEHYAEQVAKDRDTAVAQLLDRASD